MSFPDHSAELATLVGTSTGPLTMGMEPVNRPMIRHWAEAMGDENPIYSSDRAAQAVGLPSVIAPPTMLQAWIMRGLKPSLEAEAARAAGTVDKTSSNDRMMALLDEEGRTSVVATNCDQSYVRPLVPGERLIVRSSIDSISDPKVTGLGDGRFATTLTEFFAVPDELVTEDATADELMASAEPVGSMMFRILKFRPRASAPAKPPRPLPALTQDNAFFFEGASEGKLLIQRCDDCGSLRHPPLPACASCQSLAWTPIASAGRGEVYSFVVVHYPQVHSFDYPLPIALVQLDEGTRVVAGLRGRDADGWTVGDRVQVGFSSDGGIDLPFFEPEQH